MNEGTLPEFLSGRLEQTETCICRLDLAQLGWRYDGSLEKSRADFQGFVGCRLASIMFAMESPYQSPHSLPPTPPADRIKKRSLLSWWGIVPVILLCVFEGIYSWPLAKIATPDDSLAIGFLFGRILGGLLIALLIAWIVSLLSRRSRNASTIAFSIVVAIACWSTSRLSLLRSATSPLPPVLVASDDFEFEPPQGWQRADPTGENMKAMLVKWNLGKMLGVMQVSAGKPVLATTRQMAESLAGSDGRILPEPEFVDGVAGVRAESSSADLSRPRFVVAVSHGGQIYLIMVATAPGIDVAADFEHVIKTWRWRLGTNERR